MMIYKILVARLIVFVNWVFNSGSNPEEIKELFPFLILVASLYLNSFHRSARCQRLVT